MIQVPKRTLEVIGRNVVAIKEQCNALLALLADLQETENEAPSPCDRADTIAQESAVDAGRSTQERELRERSDAPAGAPHPRVMTRGDIRVRPDGSRAIRPTFGKPDGEPVAPAAVSETTQTEEAQQ